MSFECFPLIGLNLEGEKCRRGFLITQAITERFVGLG